MIMHGIVKLDYRTATSARLQKSIHCTFNSVLSLTRERVLFKNHICKRKARLTTRRIGGANCISVPNHLAFEFRRCDRMGETAAREQRIELIDLHLAAFVFLSRKIQRIKEIETFQPSNGR